MRGSRGRRGVRLVLGGLVGAGLVGSAYVLSRPPEPVGLRAELSLAEALGGGETTAGEGSGGFARALGPRVFAFPADHGPHPEYRTEWWYYTGNLDTAAGRHFGFQLTFFRTALRARPVARPSAWGATQVYMAHFALTDVGGRRFHAVDRVSREALGLAGATASPFRVWVEDWTAEGQGGAGPAMRLRAAQDEVAIDLVVESGKPAVLHGENGLSRKSAEPGNASYYYSLSRMATRGTIRLGGERHAVTGLSWMDREWSTSALGHDQVGWDWFALQLGDGREVMVYQLRRRDGSVDPASRGTIVRADGGSGGLLPEAIEIEVRAHWASPRDGTRYPARWRLRIPSEALDLEVTPHLADQELDLTVRYWEGAVRVRGTASGVPVEGHGYVELTGYAGRADSVRE